MALQTHHPRHVAARCGRMTPMRTLTRLGSLNPGGLAAIGSHTTFTFDAGTGGCMCRTIGWRFEPFWHVQQYLCSALVMLPTSAEKSMSKSPYCHGQA